MTFRKSSHCANGACVEVEFAKSSRCESSHCVEVARGEVVRVRDSKQDGGPILSFTRDEWSAFVAGAKAGEFDIDD